MTFRDLDGDACRDFGGVASRALCLKLPLFRSTGSASLSFFSSRCGFATKTTFEAISIPWLLAGGKKGSEKSSDPIGDVMRRGEGSENGSAANGPLDRSKGPASIRGIGEDVVFLGDDTIVFGTASFWKTVGFVTSLTVDSSDFRPILRLLPEITSLWPTLKSNLFSCLDWGGLSGVALLRTFACTCRGVTASESTISDFATGVFRYDSDVTS